MKQKNRSRISQVSSLQKPEFAYFDGAVRPYEGATLHVSSEAVLRGLNVFEGMKAYWQPDGSMGVVAVSRHYERLRRSAALLHFPFETSLEEFENAIHSLIEVLCDKDQDIWVRATLYMVEGHWGENQKSDLVLTGFKTSKAPPEPLQMGVSTWRRAADTVLPARIKTSTNYQVARLAKIEGRSRGYDEMVLLNQWDRVAESGGACIMIYRDGRIVTPPATEGALESITVDIVESLAEELGFRFERRPVDRTELYIADEVALVGTLVEATPVESIDGYTFRRGAGVFEAIATRYRNAATGRIPHPAVDLSTRRY